MASQLILALNAALALCEKLIPLVAGLVKSGEITIGEQADLRARYTALREAGDAAFTGPEWET
jgi:hypothetical protein